MKNMKSGIYCIKSVSTNKIYIGQSIDVNKRIRRHKTQLSKGKHENKILQRHYDKYGEDDLVFDVLEYCSIDMLNERERYWIAFFDSMNREKGFNIESGGNEGKIFSEERRRAISGPNNPMYGKHHSPEFVEYIRIRNRASSDKLTEDDVKNIKMRLAKGEKQSDLADEYNVDLTTINKIAKCKNWDWVLPELNNTLINLQDKFKKERDEKFKKLYSEGCSLAEIAKITGSEYRTIKKALKDEIEKKKGEKQELEERILQDFINGLSKDAILNKYGMTEKVYWRITAKKFWENRQHLYDEIIRLKKAGMLNKDIAKTLNISRVTVTRCLKKFYPDALKKYTKRK